MTTAAERRIKLGDGRRLGYAEFGDPDGRPVFYCHGLPASRLEALLPAAAAGRAGVRILAVDRPGCGLSDAAEGRSLLDWPGDVAALADALQLPSFAVLGVSGGGPYALACARRLAPRLTAVGVVGGLAPLPTGGLLRTMRWPARVSFSLAQRVPRLARLLCTGMLGPALRRHPGAALALLTVTAPPADRAVLARSEVRATLLDSIGESFRQGGAGVARDLAILAGPWGFAPGDIAPVVYLWHGEEDATVPCAMGHALAAAIPDCRPRFFAKEGHFSLPVEHAEEILRTLTA